MAREPQVERVFRTLNISEGVGDDVTNVATGALGVTRQARDAVSGSANMSDEEVARSYLTELNSKWARVDGYDLVSPEVKEALLDASYNMGESVLGFEKLTEALKRGDEQTVVTELLDTANVDGQTIRGLARRRAVAYNAVADIPIAEVEQKDDGTIIYKDVAGGTIFQYKTRGGRHEKSGVGTIPVSTN